MDYKQPDRAQEYITDQPMTPAYPQPYGGQQFGGQQYGGQPSAPSQQSHVSNTTVVIQQQPTIQQNIKREWSSGLCGCFEDCASCMGVWCCPTCYACHLSARMDEHCCLPICVPGYLTALRAKMRAEQNIKGSICTDCLLSCFCEPCVMCQLAREVDYVLYKQG